MKFVNINTKSLFLIAFLSLFIFSTIVPDIVEARRGGSRSFGGTRRSTPSKQYNTPRQSDNRTKSFGNNRSTSPNRSTSFGGTRLNNSREYTAKYGTPRNTSKMTVPNNLGGSRNLVVHSYGGYGSGLMTGYLMGATPFIWSLPFHPAFYYSKPYYVENPETGETEVYPPTFSVSTLIFTIIIAGAIIYVIYVIIRNRKRKAASEFSQSSFR